MAASLIVPASGFNPPEPASLPSQPVDRYLPDRRLGRTLTLHGRGW